MHRRFSKHLRLFREKPACWRLRGSLPNYAAQAWLFNLFVEVFGRCRVLATPSARVQQSCANSPLINGLSRATGSPSSFKYYRTAAVTCWIISPLFCVLRHNYPICIRSPPPSSPFRNRRPVRLIRYPLFRRAQSIHAFSLINIAHIKKAGREHLHVWFDDAPISPRHFCLIIRTEISRDRIQISLYINAPPGLL